MLRYFTCSAAALSWSVGLIDFICSCTSLQPTLFHASFFEINPASYTIAVESTSVDITAAMFINGLPLYNVISRVPVNPGAFNEPMLITVLVPTLLIAAECFSKSMLYDWKG